MSFALPGPRGVTWAFVAIGLALRLWHYVLNHTIWYDEAVLLANILGKDYSQLLGPLNHAVAAPPIFLWGLKLLSELCGDEPYCWRLVPLACSCGTLLLTVPLTRRVLSPAVAAIAVGLVAVSDNHIGLGYSIRPYAGDALFTTALLYFYVATGTWSATKRMLVLTAVIPAVLCTSYPAAFIVGGLLVALLPFAYRERFRGLALWVLASSVALSTFALLYFGPIRNQRVEGLVSEWERMFPNFHQPETVPWWVLVHTSTIFQFCFNPIGFYLFLVAPFGIVSAWRTGRRDLAILLVVPFLLAMIASALKAYPFGFVRHMLFVAPCVLLLGGLGIDVLFRRFQSKKLHLITGVLLLFIGSIVPVGHLFQHRDQPDSAGVAKHIRTHRTAGDFVASDEQTYVYFFRGELKSLDEIAALMPPGSRVWVPMDFHEPDERRAYVKSKLEPGGLRYLDEAVFHDTSAFLFEKPAR